jgi:hypothetical protein
MWQFSWDIIGYIHDSVPRWAKITVAALIMVTIGFFFGYRVAVFVAGGVLWFAVGVLVVSHVVVLTRNLRKQREVPPPPLTPADQADVEEFQAAMQGTELAETAQTPAHEQPPTDPLYQPPQG